MSATRLRLTLIERGTQMPEGMAPGETIEVALEPSRPIHIGRAPFVDVRVIASSVGRQVVRLTPEPEGIRIDDLGSGGGSALEIDGVLERRPHRYLPDNSVLWIGAVAFRVQLDDSTGTGGEGRPGNLVLRAPELGWECEIPHGASGVLGRSPEGVDHCLPHVTVDRRHARVFMHEGSWYVEDLRSRSGIYVNGVAAHAAPHLIRPGDVLRVGGVELTVGTRPPIG